MNTAMDQLCASYGDDELQLLADFLHRTSNAGRTATDELASDNRPATETPAARGGRHLLVGRARGPWAGPALDRLTVFAYGRANSVSAGRTRWPSSSTPRSTSTPHPSGSGRASPTLNPTPTGTRSSPGPAAAPASVSGSPTTCSRSAAARRRCAPPPSRLSRAAGRAGPATPSGAR